jgi:ABC-type bacteriocin/lantibiotic exporter with double-glycine peptidase domain
VIPSARIRRALSKGVTYGTEQAIPDDALSLITNSGSLSQATNSVEDELIISAVQVNKYFGDKHVLKDVDFEVRKKEVVALIGPSGSGKSTLIRCFNGLEKHTSGEIYIHGQRLIPTSLTNSSFQSVASWAWSSRILTSFPT